jgi:hypothetical protein
MKKSILLSLAMAAAMMPSGQTFEVRPTMPELGYRPTTKKHTAKRKAKKQGVTKSHKERNKKGRP